MSEVQIFTDEVKEVTVTDSRGRVLKLRKPGMLAQYRLVAMLGKSADSETYLNMCMPLIYLYSIDDDSNVPCDTVRQMEALIQRLGDSGISALMKCVQENYGEVNPDEAKEEIKK